IGLSAAEARRMSCVPKATKGRSFEARDGAGLTAAVAEAVRLANPDPDAAAPLEAAPTAPAPTEAPGMRLTAALAGVGPALKKPVKWRVTRKQAPDEIIAEREAPDLNLNVQPGTYEVEASLGLAKARKT